MELTNGELNVELPESLAKLLLAKKSWHEGTTEQHDDETAAHDDEAPLPMTHIPGVVPGISMNRLKKAVADGDIPHTLKDRTKLVKPSDVRAFLAKQ